MGKGEKKAKKTRSEGAGRDPMTDVLDTFRDPTRQSFDDAWVGMEPTFQTAKAIKKWRKLCALGEPGEDLYFKDEYMLGTQRDVARAIARRFEKKKADGAAWCMFDEVEVEEELDQWKVTRQNLKFRWADRALEDFECKWTLDPETFEWSIKPVPLAWFYDARFVRFLEELMWGVPLDHGLSVSMAHGGGQYSLSAKTFLSGSLLADDIASRLNHPEQCTWLMDYPNSDDRAFRATTKRFEAFKRCLDAYWAGGFHPKANGTLTPENAYLDRGFGPAPSPPKGLMDQKKGPLGSAREVFQTNFAFARAVRLQAQAVHPGYWQSQNEEADGYRPDQIMRYSEGNLNRLQIAGEHHVKSGKLLQANRAPEFDAPLQLEHLTDEAGWETRASMSRTSARDFVEGVLVDVHYARWLQDNPHVKVVDELEQDALLRDGEATVKKYGGEAQLRALRAAARAENLDNSNGKIKSDWIEPETLFWAAWKVLPDARKATIAREVVTAFVERVEKAASKDPRPEAKADPMEWHRHRVHPLLWSALSGATLKGGDPVKRELEAFQAKSGEYLARRPQWSQTGDPAPWDGLE
jgi:hypothetical protein